MMARHAEDPSLFGAAYERQSRQLPIIGEQKDIRYYASPAKSILNGPETTGMGFWSINPYVGCAFGCAYCYARYTHRWVMERAADDHKMVQELGEAYNKLPPWLAFERNIFVKKNAPEILSRTLRFGSDRHLRLLQGETIVIGTATDPYQPAERRFRITRGILEVLAEQLGFVDSYFVDHTRSRSCATHRAACTDARVTHPCALSSARSRHRSRHQLHARIARHHRQSF
ncbi:MAG: hypothetical protein AUG20_03720 [Gemmatimonas sp. 13_1_20CM_3_60_15]|nr:MAG: hypothetical protein AUG20_03720 [Gemmatimonas sp. 13_1_20CM_3_60_15]